MELEQNGVKLTGKARTIGFRQSKEASPERPVFIVEQMLTGAITGRTVQLVGTNYEILHDDTSYDTPKWQLDSWSGNLETADVIAGEITDANTRGSFIMNRTS
jgi:hypothetical protein